jgi:tRNA(Ile)-lysidine synthase TilS/MesJ
MTIELQKEAIPLEVRRHKLVATVRYQLDDNVLVGVSGGADSVALLLLCCSVALQQSSSLRVVVGHIHHGIRHESDAEQLMVESLCKSLREPARDATNRLRKLLQNIISRNLQLPITQLINLKQC